MSSAAVISISKGDRRLLLSLCGKRYRPSQTGMCVEEQMCAVRNMDEHCHLCRVKWAWRNLALHHLKSSKYSAAIPAFHNVLRLDPKDSVCWKGLSQSYLATGNYFQTYPQLPGRLYVPLGKFVAAMKGFERALELDPTCAASRYQVACTKLLLGLTDEAAIQFRGVYLQGWIIKSCN